MLYTTLFFGYAASTGKFMRGGAQMEISAHGVLKEEAQSQQTSGTRVNVMPNVQKDLQETLARRLADSEKAKGDDCIRGIIEAFGLDTSHSDVFEKAKSIFGAYQVALCGNAYEKMSSIRETIIETVRNNLSTEDNPFKKSIDTIKGYNYSLPYADKNSLAGYTKMVEKLLFNMLTEYTKQTSIKPAIVGDEVVKLSKRK